MLRNLYLIARIGDERVALPTTDIGSVVEVDQISPVPRVPSHIAGLFALRSRVLTVVDARASLGLGTVPREPEPTAIIVDCEGHSYALLVDAIEDVLEAAAAEPCPSLLGGEWRRVALGVIRREEEAILLVSPAALVAGPEPLAA